MAYYSTQCISKFLIDNEKTKGTVFIGPPGIDNEIKNFTSV